MIIGLDTESTYTKDRDIRSLGATNYIRHPETEHYLVSLWTPEWHMVCPPSKVPWDFLQGTTLVSHNRSYDQRVITHIAPPLELAGWHCSADLAAFVQSPRALKDASAQLLGIRASKEIRDKMKGKRIQDLDDEGQASLYSYALKDAELSWQLWDTYGTRMPEHERRLSEHTTLLACRGIRVDEDALEKGAETLLIARERREKEIPWAETDPVTSPKALARECRKLGIEPPTSTEAKSEEWDAWARAYEETVPLVKAIQEWRSVNRTLKVIEAMQIRQSDGILPVELKYGGANHTMRWSGSGGLNMQNLPRKPVEGVDCRSMLIPREGKVFVVADYAQIEARVLLWLAGDQAMLNLLASGVDLYEAHARQTMGYSDPRPLKDVNPAMRQMAKIRVLGLGYGLGVDRFQWLFNQWTGQTISLAEAERHVRGFRQANRKIVGIWNRLGRAAAASTGGSFFCELPSGRRIEYFDVQMRGGDVAGRVELGGPVTKLWGGRLTENLVQATARDILADAILRLEVAGLPVVLHVHDEVIVEADASAQGEVEAIMRQAPEWAEGCPIEVEAKIMTKYGK